MTNTIPAPIEVFCSYADADERLWIKLEKHLRLLNREGLITSWHKRRIIAGTDWTQDLDSHLNTASIILLLVSADFFASNYFYSIELKRALERHEAGEAIVIPILLRRVDWELAPFSNLKALPSNRMFITKWNNRKDAFTDVAKGIRKAVEELHTLTTPSASVTRSIAQTNGSQDSNTQGFLSSSSTQLSTPAFSEISPIPITHRPFFAFPLEGKTSRRAVASSLAALIAGGVGATWWKLAEVPSQHAKANPLLVIYPGHHESVWRVRWSPNGTRIASGGGDHTVQIWYAYYGRHFQTYYGLHNTNIRAIAWSPDNMYIAFGGDDKTVQVWDVATDTLIYTYYGNTNFVWDLAWSPNGLYIASAGWDKTVQVWNAQTGQHLYTYHGHSDTVRSVTWSPDSKCIASASRDLLVQVWEANTGKPISSYSGRPTDTLMSVAWSPNGLYIASAGWDHTVQVWAATTGKHIFTYSGHTGVVMEVAWSHDSKRIASASTDWTVQVWDALTGSHVYIYRGHTSRVYSVTWSPDDQYLASGQDRAVYVWQPG